MRILMLSLLLAAAIFGGACVGAENDSRGSTATAPDTTTVPVAAGDQAAIDSDVSIVIAPGVKGRVDEALMLDAYRRAVAQGEQDFGFRPERPVTIYIDP